MRFFFLALFFFSALASAEQCTRWTYAPGTSFFSTAQEACASLAAKDGGSAPTVLGLTGNNCQYTTQVPCQTGMCSQRNLGSVYEAQTECAQSACAAQTGQSKVVNFTVGYTRSSNIDTDPNWKLIGAPNQVPASGLLCNPQSPCEMRFNGFSDGDMAWQSAAPTPNGLYRLSLDISATFTGETCSPTQLDNAALRKTLKPDDQTWSQNELIILENTTRHNLPLVYTFILEFLTFVSSTLYKTLTESLEIHYYYGTVFVVMVMSNYSNFNFYYCSIYHCCSPFFCKLLDVKNIMNSLRLNI